MRALVNGVAIEKAKRYGTYNHAVYTMRYNKLLVLAGEPYRHVVNCIAAVQSVRVAGCSLLL